MPSTTEDVKNYIRPILEDRYAYLCEYHGLDAAAREYLYEEAFSINDGVILPPEGYKYDSLSYLERMLITYLVEEWDYIYYDV